VAREAGVSMTTVSHALNGTRFVAEETKQRIFAAVERLKYEVNSVAQSLKSDKSHAIGLLITDISNPFFTSLVRGVEDVANRAGYSVILCNTDEDSEKELSYLRMLRRKRVDGILLAPTGTRQPFMDAVVEGGFPVVCIDRRSPGAPCDTVLVDNVGGARAAVDHLIDLGHRRIGVISGLAPVGTSSERLAGYREALRAHGLREDPALVQEGNSRLDGGYHRMLELLDLPTPPTAVFTTNNLMTLGALGALQARGVGVPDDVAVVGFDDFEWAVVLRPRLTTVAQPTYEIGETAARLLLERIEKKPDVAPRRVVLPTRLLVRESCGAGGQPGKQELEDVFGRPAVHASELQPAAR
jgi:DNA-binding LacI/PurR family transcriptional regulator